jgi:4-oxalmesaconate hydratase
MISMSTVYTTAPAELRQWRNRQKDNGAQSAIRFDQRRPDSRDHRAWSAQFIKERGADLTPSLHCGRLEHHVGGAEVSLQWTRTVNDLIHRVCSLFPDNFIGVCQLPQSPGISPKNCIEELERCVLEYGFVGCNVNPDPTDGYWTDPPMTNSWWYPLYEKMIELQGARDDPRQRLLQPELPRHRRALHQRRYVNVHAVHPF